MRFKADVVLPLDMDVRMMFAFQAINDTFRMRDHLGEPWITSFADGKHSPSSYHYKGRAIDLRTKGSGSARFIHNEIRERISHLGFDVVLEDEGGVNEHVHIELDKRADTLARREAAKIYADTERRDSDNGSPDRRPEGGEAGSIRADSVVAPEGDS